MAKELLTCEWCGCAVFCEGTNGKLLLCIPKDIFVNCDEGPKACFIDESKIILSHPFTL